MIQSTIKLLIPAALVATLTIYIVSLPQDRNTESVVPVDANSPTITLNRGDSIRQTMLATGKDINGFVIFTPIDKLIEPLPRLVVRDQSNTIIASSQSARTEYHHDLRAILINTTTITPAVKDPLTVEVTSPNSRPLDLLINPNDTYAGGQLASNQIANPATDLAFSTLHPAPTSAATKIGVIVGLITLLGSLLIAYLPRHQWLAAGLLVTLVLPLATAGFWFSEADWGMSDWDYFGAMHEGYRTSIADYHTFPFWNPYTFGGVAGLGDPEFPVLSFNFFFELIFGVMTGFRLAIYASLIICGLGMLALGKRLGFSVHAALLTAIAFPLSTSILNRFVEGHVQYFAIAWVPWIFWAWIAAYRQQKPKTQNPNNKQNQKPKTHSTNQPVWNLKSVLCDLFGFCALRSAIFKQPKTHLTHTSQWILLCGIFLSLTFYQGGIYILFYILPAFLLLIWLSSRPRAAFIITLQAGLWSFGLSAFKVLPTLAWLREWPDDFYHVSSNWLPYWFDVYLIRHLHGAAVLTNQSGGWHEYGSYIGPVVFILAVLSLSQLFKTKSVRVLLVGFIAAAAISSAGEALVPLFDVVIWLPRSNIVRLTIFSVFSLVLLAGFGLNTLHKQGRLGRYLVPTIVGLVAIDIMSLAYPMSEIAFTIPPLVPPLEAAPSPIAFTNEIFDIRHRGFDEQRTFAATRAGYGTLSYRPNTAPPLATRATDQPNGEYLQASHPDATITIKHWTPNQVQLEVDTPQETDITINGNFARGWRANNQPAQNHQGRVGATVPAGQHRLEFKYRSPGYLTGLTITILTILLAATVSIRRLVSIHRIRQFI